MFVNFKCVLIFFLCFGLLFWILYPSPAPQIIENFISQEEAQYLITISEQFGFKRSTVQIGNKPASNHSDRTSSSMTLPSSDHVVAQIRTRVADFLQVPETKIEPLQIVKYKYGEEYKAHYDASSVLVRKHTILVYLNSLENGDGGGTIFPEKSFRSVPKVGRAIYFQNLDIFNRPQNLHAGEIILNPHVTKYALNIWIKK